MTTSAAPMPPCCPPPHSQHCSLESSNPHHAGYAAYAAQLSPSLSVQS